MIDVRSIDLSLSPPSLRHFPGTALRSSKSVVASCQKLAAGGASSPAPPSLIFNVRRWMGNCWFAKHMPTALQNCMLKNNTRHWHGLKNSAVAGRPKMQGLLVLKDVQPRLPLELTAQALLKQNSTTTQTARHFDQYDQSCIEAKQIHSVVSRTPNSHMSTSFLKVVIILHNLLFDVFNLHKGFQTYVHA